jgi:hypothetical protein
VLRIDAKTSREFQGVLSAVRAAPKEFQAQIRSQTKVLGTPEWKKALAETAPVDRRSHKVIVATAKVTASNQNVALQAAKTGTLRRGVKNIDLAAATEFGANRNQTKTYQSRSRKGRSFTVHNRHTQNQLLWRKRTGHTFYPATAAFIPRIAALWAQTTVRTIAAAFEGKRG